MLNFSPTPVGVFFKMKLSETKIWQRLNQIQKQHKQWFLIRIESSTINGIPDVYACISGSCFWLGLKCNEVKNRGLSKYQINWHIKHRQSGGLSFILNYHASKSALELLEVRDSRVVHLVEESPVTKNTFNKKLELTVSSTALRSGILKKQDT